MAAEEEMAAKKVGLKLWPTCWISPPSDPNIIKGLAQQLRLDILVYVNLSSDG